MAPDTDTVLNPRTGELYRPPNVRPAQDIILSGRSAGKNEPTRPNRANRRAEEKRLRSIARAKRRQQKVVKL